MVDDGEAAAGVLAIELPLDAQAAEIEERAGAGRNDPRLLVCDARWGQSGHPGIHPCLLCVMGATRHGGFPIHAQEPAAE
jgi:hypothetical protein